MRRLLILPLVFAAATPALATETISCRVGRTEVLRLTVATGGVRGATLVAGRVERTTDGPQPELSIAQAWIDRTELKADLMDGNAEETLGALRARAQGDDYVGTLVTGRVTRPVRCGEAG